MRAAGRFQFPLPVDLPDRLSTTLLVAWVAFHNPDSRLRYGIELSERTAQMRFGVSSRATARKAFREARDLGYLTIVERAGPRHGLPGRRGHSYELGPTARHQAKRWRQLAHELYNSHDGLLSPLMSSGFMLYNAFGRDGRWLTLALLQNAGKSGTSATEIYAAAAGLLRSPALVVKHLDRFASLDLAAVERRRPKVSSRYVYVADDEQLSDLAWSRLWAPIYIDMQRRIQDEQLGLTKVTAAILKLNCTYCGTPPGADRDSKMTIEHLPPQTWTSSREFGLLLPACFGCNTSLGGRLSRHKEPPDLILQPRLALRGAESWATLSEMSDHEVLASLEPLYTAPIRDYRDGVVSNDWRRARRAAVDLAPFSEAVRGQHLELVSRSTGEVRRVEVPLEFAVRVAQVSQVVVPRAAVIGGP